mmetsp:Transcript_4822/g.7506  ORF Transcript_4822/g.7506 Transcript_4822/m.7506 type:complete len:243 (-) Transcript_4822:61-789(-)
MISADGHGSQISGPQRISYSRVFCPILASRLFFQWLGGRTVVLALLLRYLVSHHGNLSTMTTFDKQSTSPVPIHCGFICNAPRSFHANFSCKFRQYAYYLEPPEDFDVDLLDRMLRVLATGTPRCFTAFARDATPNATRDLKTIYIARARRATLGNVMPIVRIDLVADSFLRKQVRVLVATAVRHVLQKDPEDSLLEFTTVSESRPAQLSRQDTAPAACPERLCFIRAGYSPWTLDQSPDIQ